MPRPARLLTLACSALLGIVIGAAAQPVAAPGSPTEAGDQSLAPLSEDQDRELASWLDATGEWQRNDAKWQNRPARDRLGRFTARQPPPDPPAWLAARCRAGTAAGILSLDARLALACRLLADPRTAIESVPAGVQATRLDAEKPRHSSFLTRVHLDGLWTTAATTNRFYGLIGAHVSLVDVGRFQVFGPPGVLLLSVPDTRRSRRFTLGYTWGVSVRLADVRLFGRKDMTLFVNLSKVWIASTPDDQGTGRGYDIVGFSLAPRKKP